MPNVNVIDVVSAIHKRVREQEATYQAHEVIEEWSNDLAKLHSAYNAAYCARNLVGSVPVLPNTPLGVVAGWAVRFAQRILFWYTPQIRSFHEATAVVLNRLCSLEERKFRTFLALADRMEKLERETRLLRTAQSAKNATAALAELLAQAAAPHVGGYLGARGEAELLDGAGTVGLDGALGDVELLGDLGVGVAVGDQPDDLALAL